MRTREKKLNLSSAKNLMNKANRTEMRKKMEV